MNGFFAKEPLVISLSRQRREWQLISKIFPWKLQGLVQAMTRNQHWLKAPNKCITYVCQLWPNWNFGLQFEFTCESRAWIELSYAWLLLSFFKSFQLGKPVEGINIINKQRWKERKCLAINIKVLKRIKGVADFDDSLSEVLLKITAKLP